MIHSLPCQHLFHEQCLEEWVNRKNTCPVCKSSISVVCNIPDKIPPTPPATNNESLFPRLYVSPPHRVIADSESI